MDTGIQGGDYMDLPDPPPVEEYVKQKMEEGYSEEGAYLHWFITYMEQAIGDSDDLAD